MTRRELVKRSAFGGVLFLAGGVYLVLVALDAEQRGVVRVIAIAGAAICLFVVSWTALQAIRVVRGDYDERLRRL